jgi:FKBP-type peptidyl-prolyl cis-trans isomerase SlyD
MGAKKWKPGMVAVVNTEQGQRQVTVVKVGMFKAEVDTNHPLAGKTLSFDIDVIDVRAASNEEIEHGHAHGVGGHHHH